jgi:hypothetical protein
MKVAIKNKSEMKYIDTSKIEVGGVSLLELYSIVEHEQDIIVMLLREIADSYIVKKDTAYLIQIGDQLKHIDKLEIVEEQETKFPLSYYNIVDGKLELNKKKVVAL